MFSDIDFDKIRLINANGVAYKTQPRIVNTIINKLSGCAYYTGSRNILNAFNSKKKTSLCVMYKRKYPLEVTIENIEKTSLEKTTLVTYAFYKVKDNKAIDDDPTKHARLFCIDYHGNGNIGLWFGMDFKNDKEYFARTFMKCVLFENSYVDFEGYYSF